MEIVTVTSYKGGVGKTTTAICLATLLSRQGKEILVIDSDDNRSAATWAKHGGLPFEVVLKDMSAMALTKKRDRPLDYLIFDTEGRPKADDIETLAKGCNFLILPTTPDTLSLDLIVKLAKALPPETNYKLLVTNSPPAPQKDGVECREALKSFGLPVFETIIRAFKAYKNAVTDGIPVEKAKPQGGVAWGDWKRFDKEWQAWEQEVVG